MRKWLPLFAVCLAAFMLIVDTTVVTVALPDIATGLRSSLAGLQWVTNTYPLALAVLSLSAGAVGDLFGPRRVFVWSTGLFGLASLLCGLAPDVLTLILARGLQGVGASAMFVTGMALLGTAYQERDRGVAIGVWSAVIGAAAAAGPVFGGALTQLLGWRAIFAVNVPIAVLTVLLALRHPGGAARTPVGKPDLPGMFWFAVCSGSLTYGLIRAGESWSPYTLVLLAVSAVALAVLVRVERGRPRPMLDLALFRDVTFVSIMLCAVVSATAFASLVYVSIWLQATLGLGPVDAGLTLLPMAVTSFLVSTLAGRVLHRVPPRVTIGTSSLLMALGFAVSWALLDARASWAALLPGLVLTGAGVGLSVPGTSAAVLAAVPADRAGMASGALATFRQLGQVLGVAVLGLVFRGAGLGGVYLVAALLGLGATLLAWCAMKVASPTPVVSPRD